MEASENVTFVTSFLHLLRTLCPDRERQERVAAVLLNGCLAERLRDSRVGCSHQLRFCCVSAAFLLLSALSFYIKLNNSNTPQLIPRSIFIHGALQVTQV